MIHHDTNHSVHIYWGIVGAVRTWYMPLLTLYTFTEALWEQWGHDTCHYSLCTHLLRHCGSSGEMIHHDTNHSIHIYQAIVGAVRTWQMTPLTTYTHLLRHCGSSGEMIDDTTYHLYTFTGALCEQGDMGHCGNRGEMTDDTTYHIYTFTGALWEEWGYDRWHHLPHIHIYWGIVGGVGRWQMTPLTTYTHLLGHCGNSGEMIDDTTYHLYTFTGALWEEWGDDRWHHLPHIHIHWGIVGTGGDGALWEQGGRW